MIHEQLAAHREHLLRLCYRMTGSTADAEDLVQETFRRALEHPPHDLQRELRPWLVRVAMNLSRDALRARKRRRYDGTWLPSPYESAAIDGRDPETRYGERESVTFAFLLALEALSANQRAVLLLRDVLDYSVHETAAALELSEANVKTTLHRARAAMAAYDIVRLPPTAALRRQTRDALLALCLHFATGNRDALQLLLARAVRARNDGGGEFFAARKPVLGLDKVIRFHLNVARLQRTFSQREQQASGRRWWSPAQGLRSFLRGDALLRVRLCEINGLPALVSEAGALANPRVPRRSVVRIELDAHGKVSEIDTVVASRKLRGIAFDRLRPLSLRDVAALMAVGLRQPPLRSWALPAVVRLLSRWRRVSGALARHG